MINHTRYSVWGVLLFLLASHLHAATGDIGHTGVACWNKSGFVGQTCFFHDHKQAMLGVVKKDKNNVHVCYRLRQSSEESQTYENKQFYYLNNLSYAILESGGYTFIPEEDFVAKFSSCTLGITVDTHSTNYRKSQTVCPYSYSGTKFEQQGYIVGLVNSEEVCEYLVGNLYQRNGEIKTCQLVPTRTLEGNDWVGANIGKQGWYDGCQDQAVKREHEYFSVDTKTGDCGTGNYNAIRWGDTHHNLRYRVSTELQCR